MSNSPYPGRANPALSVPASRLTRRQTLISGGVCAASMSLAARALANQPKDVVFRVVRGSSPIGQLQTTFTVSGDRLRATTQLELSVYVAFVRVFRYRHVSEEVWQGNKLNSLYSETDDDGKKYSVRGELAGSGLRVTGPLATVAAPPETLTTNCAWNVEFIRQSMLIDCEKGRHVPLAVQPLGDKQIKVGTVSRPASGYRMTLPYAAGEIWYAGGEWVHGIFRTKGETLVYEREN